MVSEVKDKCSYRTEYTSKYFEVTWKAETDMQKMKRLKAAVRAMTQEQTQHNTAPGEMHQSEDPKQADRN